jgi:ABC-type nitrate/sulfonate/bicarbonate transport system substrate-binding protein
MIEYVMKQDGGDFSRVTLIPNAITDEPAALAANQTDAVWVFYGWSGIKPSHKERISVDGNNYSDRV